MKFLTLSLLLVSFAAHAGPKVGNKATFDVKAEAGDQSATGTVTLEITNFNSSTKQYLQKAVVVMNGQTETTETWMDESNFLSDAQVADFLANCARYGGTLAKTNVPAGAFDTCALNYDQETESGTIWVAKASFGFVAQVTYDKTNGVTTTATLRSQR